MANQEDLIAAFECLYDAILDLNRSGKAVARVTVTSGGHAAYPVYWISLEFEGRTIQLELVKGHRRTETRDSVSISPVVP